MASIVAINISKKKGTFKQPVDTATLVPELGIEGDAHAANWHRQISLLAQESIDRMSARGVPDFTPGKFAENITTEGIELHTLPVGTRLALGACTAQVTQIGKECHQHCQIYHQVGDCIMPREGIFVKVLTGGVLRPGDTIAVLQE